MPNRKLIAALLILSPSGSAIADTDDTASRKPRLVKLTRLVEDIRQQKGKVVVVDFWTDG